MVSKKTIKSLDFETIEQYFDYIIESKINGNFKQVIELYNCLSGVQKTELFQHIISNYSDREFIDLLKCLNKNR